jgi:hypothetical protein
MLFWRCSKNLLETFYSKYLRILSTHWDKQLKNINKMFICLLMVTQFAGYKRTLCTTCSSTDIVLPVFPFSLQTGDNKTSAGKKMSTNQNVDATSTIMHQIIVSAIR